jgi:hypothetical protein
MLALTAWGCFQWNLQAKVPDIERYGYCFSDGVGCISPGIGLQNLSLKEWVARQQPAEASPRVVTVVPASMLVVLMSLTDSILLAAGITDAM